MKCWYLEELADFFALVEEKLEGSDFTLEPASQSTLVELDAAAECEIAIVPLSPAQDKDHVQQLKTLEKVALNSAGIPVIAFLKSPDIQLIKLATQHGAYDYFASRQSMAELQIVLRRASQHRDLVKQVGRAAVPAQAKASFSAFLGNDAAMTAVVQVAQKIARTDANVLITGETGTGKELLARALHEASSRESEPFVAVACSSLPETLIEAELFGHERGAFTGAVTARRGRFEAAERGTIFLDEIGELTPSLQVKLLRVLQERTFERLGSNQSRPMHARVICATNRDLRAMAHAGQFRLDLYFRLNTLELQLPPLRERVGDILPLANTFLRRYGDQLGRPALRFSAAVLCAIRRYPWPGNVRELQHVIERAALLCDGPEVLLEHLPKEMVFDDSGSITSESESFEAEVRQFKRKLIEQRLREAGNNKVRAARSLQLSRSSLHRLIDELEIGKPQSSVIN